MNKYTQEELEYIINHYSVDGPKIIGQKLGRPMKAISKKARKMGLYRGVTAGNQKRKNCWEFSEWSYDLGYLVGVYLGDGNIWIKNNSTAYFRHNSIDEDFIKATQNKLLATTGYTGNYTWSNLNSQWVLTFCNGDFARWLKKEFGGAGDKTIKILPDMEANKGMLEGLMDSEGTNQKYSLNLRMHSDLKPIQTICKLLGVVPGPQHKGIREEKWAGLDGNGNKMYGYSVSIEEWTRAGLGTYIARKATNGVILKY